MTAKPVIQEATDHQRRKVKLKRMGCLTGRIEIVIKSILSFQCRDLATRVTF